MPLLAELYGLGDWRNRGRRGNGSPRGEKQALGKWKEGLGSHRGSRWERAGDHALSLVCLGDLGALPK